MKLAVKLGPMQFYCHPNPNARGFGLMLCKEGCWTLSYCLWKWSGVYYWGGRKLP